MLDACAAEENIQFESGDILIVRTGLTEAFLSLEYEEYESMKNSPRESAGVLQGNDIFQWHWERNIAAVITDGYISESPFEFRLTNQRVGYENLPHSSQPSCHDVFLAAWGMPIGELFDLRELSKTCQYFKRWTFFFASMPLNIEGGIASPPNAQAIF
jgi:hypothetical protein